MSFEPGQKILCIDDRYRYGSQVGQKHARITAGEIYTCSGVPNCPWVTYKGPAITVAEVHNPSTRNPRADIGFLADRFRPIDDPMLEVFRAMCKSKPKVEQE